MNANTKRDAALKLLASTGMWRSNYAPPLLHLLWRLGFDVPPPHFCAFSRNALFAGTFFGIGWGLLTLPFWLILDRRLGVAVASAAAAGAMFGLAMAANYAFGKRKHNLPDWKAFHPQA